MKDRLRCRSAEREEVLKGPDDWLGAKRIRGAPRRVHDMTCGGRVLSDYPMNTILYDFQLESTSSDMIEYCVARR